VVGRYAEAPRHYCLRETPWIIGMKKVDFVPGRGVGELLCETGVREGEQGVKTYSTAVSKSTGV